MDGQSKKNHPILSILNADSHPSEPAGTGEHACRRLSPTVPKLLLFCKLVKV